MVSSTAELFSSLFTTFSVLAIIVGTVVLGLLLYLVLKYREKDPSAQDPEDAPTLGKMPETRGKLKTIAVSVTLSSIILGVLIFSTFGAIDTIQTPPQQGTFRVNVIGFQWAWKFVYSNGYDEVGTLRVPVGEVVILHVNSTDVFHNFAIIDFKIKIDSLPGRTNTIWFVARQPGEYIIQCFELCGVGHAFMKAKLVAMEKKDFDAWYSGLKVKT